MKQLFQNLKTGQTTLEELPLSSIASDSIQIQTHRSLVSLGTERMLVSFSQASLIEKARQQPEKVKMVLDKIKSDGLKPTLDSVFSRLDEPLPLGYCNAGVVIGVGSGVKDIKLGDRVASNGPHAEIVTVPRNLVSKIPEGVGFDSAVFTVIGSIGLQGLRLANPTLGETIVVIGLGLVGQLTAQLAKANGCRVIGLDVDDKKVKLAISLGIEAVNSSGQNPINLVSTLTNDIGADAVIITASSKSDAIIKQSAGMCRKRGRVVLVGVVGLNINRSDFYEKEITFQVSCSYGPGRYENGYEINGVDYPLPFVRWTENRNFGAVLSCIKNGTVNVKGLISEYVDFEKTPDLYGKLTETESIATIIKYQEEVRLDKKVAFEKLKTALSTSKTEVPKIGVIGAGIFTKASLLPILKKEDVSLRYICSQGGASSTHLAKKFSADFSTTSFDEVLNDKEVDSVIITTRHNLHSEMVIQALNCGKHVFVEKPLALNREEVDSINAAYGKGQSVMVGFNRRFSPLVTKLKKLLGDASIVNLNMTFNAGAIPSSHWTQDPEVGGGRIIGEACHFIDLFSHIAGSPIKSVCASSLGQELNVFGDNVSIMLKCENGSQGVVNYFSNGSKAWPKESVEVFSEERVFKIDNFKTLTCEGVKGFRKMKLSSQDKGHAAQFKKYLDFLRGDCEIPIPFKQILNSTYASFAALESLQKEQWISLG